MSDERKIALIKSQTEMDALTEAERQKTAESKLREQIRLLADEARAALPPDSHLRQLYFEKPLIIRKMSFMRAMNPEELQQQQQHASSNNEQKKESNSAPTKEVIMENMVQLWALKEWSQKSLLVRVHREMLITFFGLSRGGTNFRNTNSQTNGEAKALLGILRKHATVRGEPFEQDEIDTKRMSEPLLFSDEALGNLAWELEQQYGDYEMPNLAQTFLKDNLLVPLTQLAEVKQLYIVSKQRPPPEFISSKTGRTAVTWSKVEWLEHVDAVLREQARTTFSGGVAVLDVERKAVQEEILEYWEDIVQKLPPADDAVQCTFHCPDAKHATVNMRVYGESKLQEKQGVVTYVSPGMSLHALLLQTVRTLDRLGQEQDKKVHLETLTELIVAVTARLLNALWLRAIAADDAVAARQVQSARQAGVDAARNAAVEKCKALLASEERAQSQIMKEKQGKKQKQGAAYKLLEATRLTLRFVFGVDGQLLTPPPPPSSSSSSTTPEAADVFIHSTQFRVSAMQALQAWLKSMEAAKFSSEAWDKFDASQVQRHPQRRFQLGELQVEGKTVTGTTDVDDDELFALTTTSFATQLRDYMGSETEREDEFIRIVEMFFLRKDSDDTIADYFLSTLLRLRDERKQLRGGAQAADKPRETKEEEETSSSSFSNKPRGTKRPAEDGEQSATEGRQSKKPRTRTASRSQEQKGDDATMHDDDFAAAAADEKGKTVDFADTETGEEGESDEESEGGEGDDSDYGSDEEEDPENGDIEKEWERTIAPRPDGPSPYPKRNRSKPAAAAQPLPPAKSAAELKKEKQQKQAERKAAKKTDTEPFLWPDGQPKGYETPFAPFDLFDPQLWKVPTTAKKDKAAANKQKQKRLMGCKAFLLPQKKPPQVTVRHMSDGLFADPARSRYRKVRLHFDPELPTVFFSLPDVLLAAGLFEFINNE